VEDGSMDEYKPIDIRTLFKKASELEGLKKGVDIGQISELFPIFAKIMLELPVDDMDDVMTRLVVEYDKRLAKRSGD